MKPYSLTRRLILAVLLVELASALAMIGLAAVYESVSHFRAFDVMLEGRADSVLGAVEDSEDAAGNIALDRGDLHLPAHDIFLVRDDGGRVLGHSLNWPEAESVDVRATHAPAVAFEGLEERLLEPRSEGREFRSFEVGGKRYRAVRESGYRAVDLPDGSEVERKDIVIYGSRMEPVWRSVAQAILFYALVSLLLLLASGGLMLLLLRRGLRPLNDLAAQAGKVSVQSWAFTPGEEARAVRELAPLVLALESALAGLEQSFEQQKQFVSDAAHELKTSVAVVKSSVQVLAMRPRSASEYSSGLERLQVDCARMEDLVSSMLTLAGLEAREPSGAVGSTDLSGLVRHVAEHLRTVAEVGEVTILLETSGPLTVIGDYDSLRLLATNLVLNAVQHSPAGGDVRVRLARSGGSQAMLEVVDHGRGIPADVLPHIFDRFFRGDPSRSRRTGGTGLGLAIARAVVVAAQGSIEVKSEVGVGTTVTVLLPLAAGLVRASSKDEIAVPVATPVTFSED